MPAFKGSKRVLERLLFLVDLADVEAERNVVLRRELPVLSRVVELRPPGVLAAEEPTSLLEWWETPEATSSLALVLGLPDAVFVEELPERRRLQMFRVR